MAKRRRGASLVEVLISMTLALGLFALITNAIISASRHYQRLMTANELEERCVLIMDSLSTELSETRLKSILREPEALVFPRPRDSDGRLTHQPSTGVLMWSTQVCYLWDRGSNSLLRYVEDMTPDIVAVNPSDMSPARDGAYFRGRVDASKILSRDVVDFETNFAVADGGDTDTEPDTVPQKDSRFLRIKLVLERRDRKTTRIEVKMNATARN